MMRLTPYQTHKLIKEAIPTARTVYEQQNEQQLTFDELMDMEFDAEGYKNITFIGGF